MAHMTIWLTAAIALLICLVACAGVMKGGKQALTDCMVGLQMAGTIAVLVLIILAEAMQRPSFLDLALALALLSLPAALMFAHFVERWLR